MGMAESSSSSSASAEPSVSSSQPAVRRVRVYTRTGDKGTSSLYTGERRAKDDAVFEALGDVDELNAHVGMARELATDSLRGSGVESLISRLAQIQSRLLDAGSAIATPPDSCTPEQLARVAFPGEITRSLEQWIDEMDSELPPLRNFILPGGGKASAALHICRTVCRRAERRVVALGRHGAAPDAVVIFLNRLSDFCFVAARYAALKAGAEEAVWKKAAPAPAAAAAAATTEATAAAAAATAGGAGSA